RGKQDHQDHGKVLDQVRRPQAPGHSPWLRPALIVLLNDVEQKEEQGQDLHSSYGIGGKVTVHDRLEDRIDIFESHDLRFSSGFPCWISDLASPERRWSWQSAACGFGYRAASYG